MPAKDGKTVDSRKFAKIDPRENMKLSIRKSKFQQRAEKMKKTLERKT